MCTPMSEVKGLAAAVWMIDRKILSVATSIPWPAPSVKSCTYVISLRIAPLVTVCWPTLNISMMVPSLMVGSVACALLVVKYPRNISGPAVVMLAAVATHLTLSTSTIVGLDGDSSRFVGSAKVVVTTAVDGTAELTILNHWGLTSPLPPVRESPRPLFISL